MISSVFVDRPRLAIVLAIIITIAGGLSLTRIPVAQFPDIVPPRVTVSATYPGASADVVESSVAQPLAAQSPDFDFTVCVGDGGGEPCQGIQLHRSRGKMRRGLGDRFHLGDLIVLWAADSAEVGIRGNFGEPTIDPLLFAGIHLEGADPNTGDRTPFQVEDPPPDRFVVGQPQDDRT